MNRGYRLAVSAIVGALLFTSTSPAVAAPGESNNDKIEQSRVIETSPRSLHFDNMVVGQPMTKSIEIKNVSGKAISIIPSLDLSEEYSDFLESNAEFCDSSENCVNIKDSSELDLMADESEKVFITLNLKNNLPVELSGVTLTGGITVTGNVYPEDPEDTVKEIVPDKESEKDGELAITGLSSNWTYILGGGGLLVIIGYLIMRSVTRKAPSKIKD